MSEFWEAEGVCGSLINLEDGNDSEEFQQMIPLGQWLKGSSSSRWFIAGEARCIDFTSKEGAAPSCT